MKRPNIARMQKHQARNYSEYTWELFDPRDPDGRAKVAAWQAKFREKMLKKNTAMGRAHARFWTIDLVIHEAGPDDAIKIEARLRRIERVEPFADGFLVTREEARKEMGFA